MKSLTLMEMVKQAITGALSKGAIESGDLVVVTAGVPSGATGTTNMIRVHIGPRHSYLAMVFCVNPLPAWRIHYC